MQVDIRNRGSIPGSGRSPGEEYSNPLQYSCLENPMDRGVWPATVHGVTKSSDTTDLAGTPWNLFPLILSASASQQSKWVCVWTNSDFCTPGMGSAQGPSSASAQRTFRSAGPCTAPPSTERPATETSESLACGKRACEQRMTFGREQNSTTCRKW